MLPVAVLFRQLCCDSTSPNPILLSVSLCIKSNNERKRLDYVHRERSFFSWKLKTNFLAICFRTISTSFRLFFRCNEYYYSAESAGYVFNVIENSMCSTNFWARVNPPFIFKCANSFHLLSQGRSFPKIRLGGIGAPLFKYQKMNYSNLSLSTEIVHTDNFASQRRGWTLWKLRN